MVLKPSEPAPAENIEGPGSEMMPGRRALQGPLFVDDTAAPEANRRPAGGGANIAAAAACQRFFAGMP